MSPLSFGFGRGPLSAERGPLAGSAYTHALVFETCRGAPLLLLLPVSSSSVAAGLV